MKEEIIETVNKLFVYTDNRDWDKLQIEIFTESVDFDMSSLGGDAFVKTSKQICEEWAKGFEGIDSVNHLAGNFIVDINDNSADVFVYATATHYKNSAANGKTREFVGSYNIHLLQVEGIWKIDKFKYNLKYATGNLELN
jgi:SnoaL-like domain